MNKTTIAIFAILALLMVFGLATAKGKGNKQKTGKSPIQAKAVLTPNEQPMYFRLVEATPDCIVLAQVAFSALITTKSQTTRNTFDRKVCDFVICTKAFNVLAIVELDDASHRGREKEDAARDSLLTEAGYKVLRYKKTPDVETIRADLIAYADTIPSKRLEPKFR